MTQRETELEHELAAALGKVDEQRELLRLSKEENEEKRKDIVWTMGERAKLIERIKRLEEERVNVSKETIQSDSSIWAKAGIGFTTEAKQ